MRRILSLALALTVVGCGPDTAKDAATDTDDTANHDTSDTGAAAADIDAVGDFSCFTPADSFAASTWLTQQIASSAGAPITLNGTVQDFQEKTATTNQNVTLWYGDDVSKPEDATQLNGEGGLATFTDVPSCQPTAYSVTPKAGLDSTKPTYKAHVIYANASPVSVKFESVSKNTYVSIPAILGVPLDDAKGAIAGTAYDCTRDPATDVDNDAGKIKGITVRVRGLDGSPAPASAQVRYFVDNFPDPDRTYSNDDGLWVVLNLDPGDWRIEMWGKVDGAQKLLGATVATVYPGSINISNIFAGFGDGVKYPATCLDTSEDTGDSDSGDSDTGDSE